MKRSIMLAGLAGALLLAPQTIGAQNKTPRYQIHTTAATKTIVVRGGVKYMGAFSEGYACVQAQGRKWFVINKEGQKVFDLPEGYRPAQANQYGDVSGSILFNNGRLMIVADTNSIYYKKAAIIDTTGVMVASFEKVRDAGGFVSGLARIKVDQGREVVSWYVDTDGKVLSKTLPDSPVYSLSEDRRVFNDVGKKTWGFCDAKCNIVIPAKFKDVGAFFNGLAQARNDDGLWGYIDTTGKFAIEPMFTYTPGAFYGKYALVGDKSGCLHYIDKTGKIVWTDPAPNDNNQIREFMDNGYAIWTYPKERASYIVDTLFHKVAKCDIDASGGEYRVVTYCDKWFQWYTSWNTRSKLIDWQGNTLLEFECAFGGSPFREGITSRENYYFNDKGEIIVQFKDTQF